MKTFAGSAFGPSAIPNFSFECESTVVTCGLKDFITDSQAFSNSFGVMVIQAKAHERCNLNKIGARRSLGSK